SGVRNTRVRRNDELIRGKDQLGRPSRLQYRRRRFDQFLSAGSLFFEGLFRLQRKNLLPWLGGCDHGERFIRPQRRAQISGRPQLAAAFISAALFDSVEDGLEASAVQQESMCGPTILIRSGGTFPSPPISYCSPHAVTR